MAGCGYPTDSPGSDDVAPIGGQLNVCAAAGLMAKAECEDAVAVVLEAGPRLEVRGHEIGDEGAGRRPEERQLPGPR